METVMQQTIQQTIPNYYAAPAVKRNVFLRFFDWCSSQEKFRLGWVASILGSHGCIITPITLFVVVLGGNNIIYWMAAIVAMMMSLVTNLAALPTKITIPVFALSLVIDLVLIVACIGTGLDLSRIYF
jgi:hypothetical protein